MVSNVVLEMPWPPSINHYYYKGRILKTPGRKHRAAAIEACRLQYSGPPLDSTVRVDTYFFPPDRRRRDPSNFKKAILDAITLAGVWLDDSLAKVEAHELGEVVPGGLVLVIITPLPEWEPVTKEEVYAII